MNKKVYFKVYSGHSGVNGNYYIEEIEKEIENIPDYIRMLKTGDISELPVFEPIEMTEVEFYSLPEFTGY